MAFLNKNLYFHKFPVRFKMVKADENNMSLNMVKF